jgi:hypothetical protein
MNKESSLQPLATPDFFILGPEKTGTSSMYASIKDHPEIYAPDRKELHFFDNYNNYKKGMKWYNNFFINQEGVKFEATPNYFANPMARSRMKNRNIGGLKDVKFVIILRNPFDRFVSHYSHFRRFNHIVTQNPDKMKEFVEGNRRRTFSYQWKGESRDLETIIATKNREHLFSCGEYITHLKNWYSIFGEENFMLVDYDELLCGYNCTCNEIFNFVGVQPFEVKEHWMNTDTHWKEESKLEIKISPEQEKAIKNYYKPYNEALFEYIDKDLGWNN